MAAAITRVYTYFGFGIPLDVVNGLVRCVHPGIDNHVSFGTVLNVDYDAGLMQSYLEVEDQEGRVLNAIKAYGCDLTVLGNYGNLAPGVGPRGRVSLPTSVAIESGGRCRGTCYTSGQGMRDHLPRLYGR